MEREREARRFFCKFCNESFSNGRVLGGHMRSHLGLSSRKGKKKIEIDDPGYVLRENPKKSWRFSSSGGAVPVLVPGSAQPHLCQVCGKGFEAPRALFGHLRHHSTKERKTIHCSERVVKVGNGSEPETGPVRKKRSKRVMRYNHFSNSCSFSDLNESSSDVEDVAMCLMMLSRGVTNWADFFSACESSENNSVSFEVKQCGGDESFSVKVDSCVSDSVNVVSGKKVLEFWDCDSGFVFKKPKLDDRLVYAPSGAEVERKVISEVKVFDDSGSLQSEKLGSGMKPDFVDSDVVFGKRRLEFWENDPMFVLKNPKLDDGFMSAPFGAEVERRVISEVKVFDDSGSFQSEKLGSGVKPDFVDSDVVFGKRRLEFWDNDSAFVLKKPKLDEVEGKVKVFEDSASLQVCKPDFVTSDSKILDAFEKKKQYKCKICSKSFQTHQALGGHCNAHKPIKSCSALKAEDENCDGDTQTTVSSSSKLVEYECDETSEEREISSSANLTRNEVQKRKVHECPVCYKVFRSGQALGGHKRAHFCQQRSCDDDDDDALSVKVTVDPNDEAGVGVGFKQWWGGRNYSNEALVRV